MVEIIIEYTSTTHVGVPYNACCQPEADQHFLKIATGFYICP